MMADDAVAQSNEFSGSPLDNLVSTQKGGVQNLSQLARSITNAMPVPTAAASPVSTPINNLGVSATTVLAASADRHGLIFHNPGTANVYVYPSLASTAPTTSAVGGAFLIFPGGTLQFPPNAYPNVNCAWKAFSGTGSNQALTVVEFL